MDITTLNTQVGELEVALDRAAIGSPKQHSAYEMLPAIKLGPRDYVAWMRQLASRDDAWADTDLARLVKLAEKLRDYTWKRKRMTCDLKESWVKAGVTGANLDALQTLINTESSAYALAFSLWEYAKRTSEQRQKAKALQTV